MKISYESVRSTLDALSLTTEGSTVSFQDLDSAANNLADKTRDQNALSFLLDHLAVLGLKPAFMTDGFKIVRVEAPNIDSPPEPFSFSNSPFVDRPAKSSGSTFLPLVRKSDLSKLYAHQVRWFKHPVRPNVMLPLRMSSYFLTVNHPNSRIYVDLPVVFQGTNNMRIIRISLHVFENVLYSQKSKHGNFVSLDRSRGPGGVNTVVSGHGEPSDPDLIWSAWDSEYIPYFEKARAFIENQPQFWRTALTVADHLIKFQN